jgi:cardiolipin synthase
MNRLREGNEVRLLVTGTDFFPALEEAIDAAREEIYLETYIFENCPTGQKIAAALGRAVRRGVTAHVLADGFGSKTMPAALARAMREQGVQLLLYRPDISPFDFRRSRLRRLHRKMVVIDARVGFIGGINVIDDMYTPGHTPPRMDYAVRVRGPIVDDMHAAVTRLWAIVSWTQLRRRWHAWALRCAPNPQMGTQRAGLVIRDNIGHRRDIEDAYLEAIGAARSEVLIAMAYFLPGVRFRRALMDASARGVKVVLLLQARVEYVLLHYASRALYGSMLDAGIEIQEYHRSFLHAKVAVVDGRWATVGSSNIEPFSLLVAREANVVVEDEVFARALRESLLALISDGSRRVVRESWAKEPVLDRMFAWAAYGIFRVTTGVLGFSKDKEYA